MDKLTHKEIADLGLEGKIQVDWPEKYNWLGYSVEDGERPGLTPIGTPGVIVTNYLKREGGEEVVSRYSCEAVVDKEILRKATHYLLSRPNFDKTNCENKQVYRAIVFFTQAGGSTAVLEKSSKREL